MVIADIPAGVLDVPDIGVTLRTLLGAAAEASKLNRRRTWKVRYKQVIIGSIRIKLPESCQV